MPRWNRKSQLLIGPPGEEGVLFDERFRIAFSVLKTDTQDANRMAVEVYGLSRQTRDVVATLENRVILTAGYETEQEVLAVGDVETYSIRREPPNIITEIQCGDGVRAMKEARSNISVDGVVSVRRILDKIADDLGLEVRDAQVNLGESYQNGFSFNGRSKDALNEIAYRGGWKWSIQDNELQIQPQEGPAVDEALVLSPGSGLLNSPERLDDLENEQEGWRIESFLIPKAEPGQLVIVESRDLEGEFTIRTVEHDGDTRGQDWRTTLEVV